MSETIRLVEPAIVEYLEHAPPARTAMYSAGCAERWVQVFTGLRAMDRSREENAEYVVELMDELWSGDLDRIAPDAVEALERFPEFAPREVPSPAVDDIYCFYAVLVVRYAAASILRDSSASIECGHVALTAVGQLDQNVEEKIWYEREMQFQREIASPGGADLLTDYRSRCQEESRRRLDAIMRRAGKKFRLSDSDVFPAWLERDTVSLRSSEVL